MERNPAVQTAEEAVAWAKRPSMVNPAVTNYDALKLDVQRIVRTTDAGTPWSRWSPCPWPWRIGRV